MPLVNDVTALLDCCRLKNAVQCCYDKLKSNNSQLSQHAFVLLFADLLFSTRSSGQRELSDSDAYID